MIIDNPLSLNCTIFQISNHIVCLLLPKAVHNLAKATQGQTQKANRHHCGEVILRVSCLNQGQF